MQKKWVHASLKLAALLLLAGLVASCGGGATARPAMPAASGAAPAATGAPSSAQAIKPGSSPSSALGVPTGTNLDIGRKIIYNEDVSLKVENARKAMTEIQDLANFNRGYVSDANLTGSDDGGWSAKVVLKVPASSFGDVIEKVRALGEVRQERQYTQDVTDQYIDLDARIKTLSEYEQRLRELALKAATFDEWLKLTQQINDTRIQIENLTGRLRVLSNQVDFATLNISLVQPAGASARDGSKTASLGDRIVRAFQESARAMVQIGEALVVFLAGFLPVAIVLAVVAAIAWVPVRSWRQRRQQAAAPPPPPPASPASGSEG